MGSTLHRSPVQMILLLTYVYRRLWSRSTSNCPRSETYLRGEWLLKKEAQPRTTVHLVCLSPGLEFVTSASHAPTRHTSVVRRHLRTRLQRAFDQPCLVTVDLQDRQCGGKIVA